jgi:hypothetical protein
MMSLVMTVEYLMYGFARVVFPWASVLYVGMCSSLLMVIFEMAVYLFFKYSIYSYINLSTKKSFDNFLKSFR